MLTWLRRLVIGLALAVLGLLGILWILEEGGFVTRVVRDRAARALGPLGARLSIERAELAWFEPGLELSGVVLSPPSSAGTSDVRLERVHVALTPRLDGLHSLQVEGGSVLLGSRLLDEWTDLATEWARERRAAPPPASIRGLELSLELFGRAPFEIGTLDLCTRPGADGAIEVAGELSPSLGGAITSQHPIRVRGEHSEAGGRLWASARDLVLESRALPAGASLTLAAPLAGLESSARLTLDAALELGSSTSARPKGHLRASLSRGRAKIAAGTELDELALEVDARLASPASGAAWGREAWDALADLRARTGRTSLSARAELGRDAPDGAWLFVSGEAREVPIGPGELPHPSLEPHLAFVRKMLDPRGTVDLAGTFRLAPRDAGWVRDALVRLRASGGFELTYQGLPREPRSGFPLPIRGVAGEGLLVARSDAPRPWQFLGLELAGDHGSGRAEGWTRVLAPAAGEDYPWPDMDLFLATPSIAVDSALSASLAANRHLDWIGPAFAPSGGTLSTAWRLRSGPEIDGTSGSGTLALRGVSLRWEDVPVPLDGVDGDISVLWGASPSQAIGRPLERRRPVGVEYRLSNRGHSGGGASVAVTGLMREELLPPTFDPSLPLEDPIQEIRVEIDELGLRGRDFDVLAASFPKLEREIADYGAVGRMRVSFRGQQPAAALPFRSDIEALPLEVHARPQIFQRLTRDLRGRLLIRTREEGESELRAAQFHLTGNWPGQVELFTRGTIPERGDAHVQVYGAGIDPTNTSFKGALIASLSTSTTGEIDLSDLTLAGPVDFALDATFDLESPEPAQNRFRIQLRDNDLRAEELVLRDLHGTLVQDDEVMTSDLVEATLGGHPLELRDVRTFPLAFLARVEDPDPWFSREGFWTDANGRALQVDVTARALPLDAEHMEGVLDAETLAMIRASPHWGGTIDVLGARIVVTSEFDNQGRTALRGPMRLAGLTMHLGIPIRIETARLAVEEFVQESNRNRGWARITGLDARIAERVLSDASMIAGYVDGRLTIDNLSGDFEGGRLESLGGALGSASKAVGVDLSEPYRFDVGVRLSEVDVGGLLQGVFQSSIADEGVLDADLQLSGTPSAVLALTGRGSLSLDEGALWSIPVIRELFARLGFDRSGLFDRLRARFELRDGRIRISRLELQSNLLDLVGEGWQDLDGALAYDMEVRYGLLDRLGPIGRVLYWLNNNLMRVAVRGDFQRPEVTIRNSILELVNSFEDEPVRHLPLPRFSQLGPRF